MTAMRRHLRFLVLSALAAGTGSLAACATLREILQPPAFEMAEGRTSEVRLLAPAATRPLGGAQVRVWARVHNPNPVGFTLTRLVGDVLLDGHHAAEVDLPLGLPLQAAADTVIPLDVNLSFADLPNLADRLLSAVAGGTVRYALEGTVSVDAGSFGQPSFGPATWLAGDLRVVR